MAAIGVGDKYDIALNGQGYLLGSRYLKKVADTFTPRFNTGGEGLSDLDLFKVWQQTDFTGGAMQERFEDETRYLTATRMVPNPDDKRLYPTPAISDMNAAGITDGTEGQPVHYAVFKNELYCGATRYLKRWNRSTLAWDTSKDFGAGNIITGVQVLGNYLWVATGGTLNEYWTYTAATLTTTWAAATLTTQANLIQAFNGWIYYTGQGTNGLLYRRNGVLSGTSAKRQELGEVFGKYNRINSLGVFNQKLMIGSAMGLAAYDESRVSEIVDMRRSYADHNCEVMTEFQGYWYYSVGKSLYRYTGTTVEKLYRFNSEISALEADSGRMFIGLKDGVMHQFDGVAFTHFQTFSGRIKKIFPVGISLLTTAVPVDANLTTDFNRFLVVAPYQAAAKYMKLHDLFALADTTASTHVYESSEIDGGFPTIKKYVDSVMVNHSDLISGDSLVVKVSAYNDNAWSSYYTLGTLDAAGENKLYIKDQTSFDGVFERLKIKVEMTVASRTTEPLISIKSVAADYVPSPDINWEWLLQLRMEGQSDNPTELKDDAQTPEPKTPRQLREAIYSAARSRTPIGFEDIDFTLLNGGINSAVATITVDDTTTYPSAGFIKIDDEIIEYTGKTATTFTGCLRGRLGTSAASHSDNTIVNMYYRVIATLSEPGEDVPEPSRDTFGSESIFNVTLREV